MPGLVSPTVRVATLRAAPVFPGLAATMDTVDALVAEGRSRYRA